MSRSKRPAQGKLQFSTTLIKQMMYEASEEVGVTRKGALAAVSKATELFIEELVERAKAICVEKGDMKMDVRHIAEAAQTDEKFSFLRPTLLTMLVVGPESIRSPVKARKRGGGAAAAEEALETQDGEDGISESEIDLLDE